MINAKANITEMKDYMYSTAEALTCKFSLQLRRSGGDVDLSHGGTNVATASPKEAELCSTGGEHKWLNVTFMPKQFKHGPEALSCSPRHSLGKLSLPVCRSHSWWSFSLLCSQEAHLWVSQTDHPGTEPVPRAGGKWSPNIPRKPSSNVSRDGSHEKCGTFTHSSPLLSTRQWQKPYPATQQFSERKQIDAHNIHQHLSIEISLEVLIYQTARRANKLTEQVCPLKIKVSVSSHITRHSKDEIYHHTPSLQPAIKCRAISTESVELALTPPMWKSSPYFR